MMTEKLFYKNSFVQEFDATVISCTQDKKGWAVVLDATAFYPEGGGQPCDRGTMTWGENTVNITDVREKGEIITHYADGEVPQGTVIHGVIDWNRRFDFMQQHTGEHIFSGIVNKMFGYNNVGFHLSERENVVDFDGPMTKEDIRAVMDRCNQAVWSDQPVIANYPDNVKELEYRSKKELQGAIRIVRAGNADICACCGTHTATTAQAGPIVAINQQAYKGGTRITIACGSRAVDYLKQRNDDCFNISHQLSVPVENITEAVTARLDEIGQLKFALANAKRQLMAVWAEKATTDGEVCIMVKEDLLSNEIQTLTALLAEKAQTAVVLSPQPESNCKICIMSKKYDTNKLGRHISATLGGKGGGKPSNYQGFVEKTADEDLLLNLINTFE